MWAAGVFYGGRGNLLGIQILGVLIEIAWVVTMTTILFVSLKLAGILRTPADVERAGMDVSKHGGYAYPTEPNIQSTPPTAPGIGGVDSIDA